MASSPPSHGLLGIGLEGAVGGSGSEESPDDSLNIQIIFNQNESFHLPVSKAWTIDHLKSMLSQKTNLPPHHINLVLAGQLLQDTRSLGHYDVGSNSVLHAFCWSDDGLSMQGAQMKEALSTPDSVEPESSKFGSSVDYDHDHNLLEMADTNESNTNSPSTGLNRFFVFCKICDYIRPAVLRVQCKVCGNGAFIVHKDPSNWDDISSSTTLRGTCQSRECDCDIPRFYCKCTKRHSEETEGTAVLLKHVQANYKMVECIICGIVSTHILIFPCDSGHVICLSCFQEYGDSCLKSRQFVEDEQFGYTLPCPAGCPESLVEENHHFLLMGKEKYERYKNFGAEEFVLKNGGVLCPRPGCGAGLFADGNTRYIKCEECKFESCRNCHMEYHQGSCHEHMSLKSSDVDNFSVDDERAQRASWERQSLSYIEVSTKPCPGCGTKTEKSGGCMHMECSRCHENWCWICVKKWNRDCQSQHWFG